MSAEVILAPATPETRRAEPSRRLAWVDAARGYCVVAVVLFHVLSWWALSGEFDVAQRGDRFWTIVGSWLGSLRMPLLLAVSGLVMSRQVRAGLRRSTTVFRAATNAYLYVVWVAIYAVFFALVDVDGLPHRFEGLLPTLRQVVVPGTTLWYLFALALYVPILAALHRVPSWIVLTLLVPLSVWAHSLEVPGTFVPRVLELTLFFAIGVYAAPFLRAAAERVGVLMVAAVMVVAAGATLLGRVAEGPIGMGVLFVLRGIAFMVMAVLAVAYLSRWRLFLRLGVFLGRHTLSLYVLHPLAVYLLIAATPALAGPLGKVWESELGAFIAPVVVVCVIVAICRLVELGTRAAQGSAIWELPPRLRARFGR